MAAKKKTASSEPVDIVGEALPESAGAAAPALVLARDLYPEELPVIPVVGRPMFPRLNAPVVIDNPELVTLLTERFKAKQKYVAVVLRKEGAPGAEPAPQAPAEEMYRVGVVAEILQASQPNENVIHMLVATHERLRIVRFTSEKPVLMAQVEYLLDPDMSDNAELKAYSISVVQAIKGLVQLNPLHKEELALLMQHGSLSEPGRLADIAAALTTATAEEQQAVLETVNVRDRLDKVLVLLHKEINISRIQVKIGSQVEERISKNQREFFLREQLRAIKKELGIEKEGKASEVDRLLARAAELKLSDEARERFDEEIEKLKLIEPVSPEFSVTRNYLDWLTALPWGIFTQDQMDLKRAAKLLDEDHYGLEDVKERILEFLAVGILTGGISGSILCFVGPPGVGKTSLGRSIARALGREFIRQSLGGVHDEAEIRGHRRTYIGAMPGRIIQAIRRAGTRNPVFMLDEVDKLGADFRGDPSSALLEVLDPEQNREFRDNYLDVPFDLSQVMFITTANVLDTIPAPLRDRMEILQLSGYTEEEKVAIGQQYLVPRQLLENGLRDGEVTFEGDALRRIIREYTREAGVRELERQIGAVCRKVATRIAEGSAQHVTVLADEVPSYLGKPDYVFEVAERTQIPGVATGLAWTPSGGDILFIEATKMKGSKGFTLTGQLGDVMRESAQAALSFVRANTRLLGIDEDAFSNLDIHLHVPAGAVPKDGPSAGVAMATAIASVMKEHPVDGEVGMTGEITLRGLVLPVGGIKEKVLAARRAGLKKVCLPRRNEKDLDELPEDVREEMQFILVDRVEQVFDVAFGNSEGIQSAQIEKEQRRTE